MTPAGDGWDWWSEVKLQVLRQYLRGFTTAVRGQSSEAIYLDLFAGSYETGDAMVLERFLAPLRSH